MAPSARCVSIDTVRNAGPGECERGRGENPPVRIAVVARPGRRIERKPRAVEADQAVGELVLYGLELADELAELLSDLGVIHGKIERALGRAERPAGTSEPCHQRDVRQSFRTTWPATAQAHSPT